MAGIDHALDRIGQLAVHIQIAPKPWGQGGFGGKLCQGLGGDGLHHILSLELFPFKRNQLKFCMKQPVPGSLKRRAGLSHFL
jgi:hypothetical protein